MSHFSKKVRFGTKNINLRFKFTKFFLFEYLSFFTQRYTINIYT